MKERTPKQVFTIIGFALVAGTLAEILGSLLVLPRLLANMQSLASSFGPSAIVLLMYVPNFCFLLVFWLVARLVPKNTWSKENMSFRSLLAIFLMMYFGASLLNGAGLLFTRNTPGGGEEQLNLIGSVVNTGTLMGESAATARRRPSSSQPSASASSTAIWCSFSMPLPWVSSWAMSTAKRAR